MLLRKLQATFGEHLPAAPPRGSRHPSRRSAMSEQTALARPRADRIRGRALAPAVVSQSHHSLSSGDRLRCSVQRTYHDATVSTRMRNQGFVPWLRVARYLSLCATSEPEETLLVAHRFSVGQSVAFLASPLDEFLGSRPLHHPPAYASRRWRLSIQRPARDNRRDPAGTRNTAQTDTAADPNSEDPTASASTRQTGSKPQNRQREALTAIPDRSRWGQVACWRICVHSLVPTSGTHG